MAHLDLKIRLQDAQHAEHLKQHFIAKGAELFFKGWEADKIYQGPLGSMIKHRHCVGLGNASWVHDPESDEITGIATQNELIPMDKSWAIHYRENKSGLPSPHYLVTISDPVLKGIGKNIYTDKNLYAEVVKTERSVYWLTQRSDIQGERQSNLRLHFDKMDFGGETHFLEIEAKFGNAYTDDNLRQAQKDLKTLKKQLQITDQDIIAKSYGLMQREKILGDLSFENEWLQAVPFGLLQDFAASKRRVFTADQNLMVENGLNDGAYVVLDGKTRVFHENKTYDFGRGYVLGELATYNGTDIRCATVKAVEETTALHISKELTSDLCSCPNVMGSWLKRYAPIPVRA